MILNDVLFYYPARLRLAIAEFAHRNGVDWLVCTMHAKAGMEAEARRAAAEKRALESPLPFRKLLYKMRRWARKRFCRPA